MIPAAFDYEVAGSVEDALRLLGGDPEARVLAGGHSLVPAMKLRISRPSKLVDIGRLSDLSYVRDAGQHLAIGALTTHDAVQKDPLAAGALSDRLVDGPTGRRSAGPASRHDRRLARARRSRVRPACGDARARCRARDRRCLGGAGRSGVRVLHGCLPDGHCERGAPDGDPRPEARGLDGLVVSQVPPPSAGLGDGRCRRSRTHGQRRGNRASVALANMGGTPLRATAVESAIAAGSSAAEAAAHAADGTDPSSDTAASAAFRRHLAQVLTERALGEALMR